MMTPNVLLFFRCVFNLLILVVLKIALKVGCHRCLKNIWIYLTWHFIALCQKNNSKLTMRYLHVCPSSGLLSAFPIKIWIISLFYFVLRHTLVLLTLLLPGPYYRKSLFYQLWNAIAGDWLKLIAKFSIPFVANSILFLKIQVRFSWFCLWELLRRLQTNHAKFLIHQTLAAKELII